MPKTFNNKLPEGLKEAFIAIIFDSFNVVNVDEEEREDYFESF